MLRRVVRFIMLFIAIEALIAVSLIIFYLWLNEMYAQSHLKLPGTAMPTGSVCLKLFFILEHFYCALHLSSHSYITSIELKELDKGSLYQY